MEEQQITKDKVIDSTEEFEHAAANKGTEKYNLRLYVTGMTIKSINAIENVRKLCEQYLPGRYELDVVDIYQKPDVAKAEQLIAAPTLIKKLPLPLRRFIGDMSDKEKILVGLNIISKPANKPKKDK